MIHAYIAKKMGEVLAFERVGLETFQRGSAVLAGAITDFAAVQDGLVRRAQYLEHAFTKDPELGATMQTKATATGTKLLAMRDLYVADQWDNLAELCEWSGFFEGAAIVHWQLILGVAQAAENQELIDVAQEAITSHGHIFATVGERLMTIGKEKYQQAV